MYNDTQRTQVGLKVLRLNINVAESKVRTRQIKRETRGGCEQAGSNLDALTREQSSN